MKNIVIVGTGGFASEIVQYIKDNQKNMSYFDYKIKGFLDITDENIKINNFNFPLLGNENTYNVEDDDCFILAIGENSMMNIRKDIVSVLKRKKAKFMNLIHYTSNIADNLSIGEGNIIAPFCVVGPRISIGSFNAINYHCSIAHDCLMQDFNILSPNCAVTGKVKIGSSNFLGASTTVSPGIIIGNENKIQSGLVVSKNINNNSFVYSNTKIASMVFGL
ncbi:hypothetical protein [Campylobacter concisus]|uniref:PglD-related sugar-binding protein n=1 Tax=Campylobacter concisus TaxID=199 RepID=UPI000CD900DD|nr:hypothetical protein [Campylobacter concisus]